MPADHTHFLSCDWGTTTFRLQLVSLAEHRVVADIKTDDGAKAINLRAGTNPNPTQRANLFADHLRAAVLKLLDKAGHSVRPMPVVVSGMASSSIGWKELPYAPTPFAVDGSGVVMERLSLDLARGCTLPVFLISGLATEREMMRGEETQVIGLLGLPHFTKFADGGIIVIPGTHSKHVRIEKRQIVDLQTFMTSELYQVLHLHSILRFTTTTDASNIQLPAFEEGVQEVLSRGLSSTLFQARTRGVLGHRSNEANRAFLCGALIGDEVATLAKTDEKTPVLFAMNGEMSDLYLTAARLTGIGGRAEAVNHELFNQLVVGGQARLLEHFTKIAENT